MTMSNEQARVSNLSQFYFNEQLDIDRALIQYRYEAIKPFFKGRTCLELGPADGWMTRCLVNEFAQVTVVDGSLELLGSIPSFPNLVKIHAMFEDINVDGQFDTVILEHILEHVDDPVGLMRRARHFVAPGGVILLGVPNALSLHRLAAVKMGLLPRPDALNERDHALGHRRVYTPDLFKADIREAGLGLRHFGGVFLKPLSNKQIQDTWTPQMVRAFFELGQEFPEIAGEIFAVCDPG